MSYGNPTGKKGPIYQQPDYVKAAADEAAALDKEAQNATYAQDALDKSQKTKDSAVASALNDFFANYMAEMGAGYAAQMQATQDLYSAKLADMQAENDRLAEIKAKELSMRQEKAGKKKKSGGVGGTLLTDADIIGVVGKTLIGS